MSKLKLFGIAALIYMVGTAAAGMVLLGADVPALLGRVNDHAKVLSSAQIVALDRKLQAIEQLPGKPQLVVLLPDNMNGQTIERYSVDVARAWKVGQWATDNGALLVIAPRERKWRIEVGYGLEGVIPDSVAKRIITEQMDPFLKGGKTQFYEALDAAIGALEKRLSVEKVQAPLPGASGRNWFFFSLLVGGGIATAVIAINSVAARRHRRLLRDLEARTWAATTPTVRPSVRPYVPPATTPTRVYRDERPSRRDDSSDILVAAALGAAIGSSSSDSGWSSSSSDFGGAGGGDFGGGGASGGD